MRIGSVIDDAARQRARGAASDRPRLRARVLAATALLALGLPLAVRAADGKQMLDCMRRAESGVMTSMDGREIVAAITCRGSQPAGTDFTRRLDVSRECFSKVTFQLRTRGPEAEMIAATACAGAFSASETSKCVDAVTRKFRSATGNTAEMLAAMACARGNAAAETAACVDQVSFRVSASGDRRDLLAAIACGK